MLYFSSDFFTNDVTTGIDELSTLSDLNRKIAMTFTHLVCHQT